MSAVDFRAAIVTMLEAYRADVDLKMQVYPGRPRSINPPTAFVDRMGETISYPGITLRQRTPRAEVLVLHGLFDSKDTAEQRDAFVDGFLDWVTSDYHAAGANTLIAVVGFEDDATYVPDWLQPQDQRTYFATQISVEGYAQD